MATNFSRFVRFMSIRFSTHPQSPDQIYFLSLEQIDFRHVESTEGETIHVDSIYGIGFMNQFPVRQIANTKDELTLVGCIGQPSGGWGQGGGRYYTHQFQIGKSRERP